MMRLKRPKKKRFSHLDNSGSAIMVDVSGKPPMKRTAIAEGKITLKPGTVALIREGLVKKGDVLAAARIAGILAAKKTGELIPLCHPLSLDQVTVDLALQKRAVRIRATAVCVEKTGVEMEALVAVSIAALTVYDMCKAVDKQMIISDISLISKTKETLS